MSGSARASVRRLSEIAIGIKIGRSLLGGFGRLSSSLGRPARPRRWSGRCARCRPDQQSVVASKYCPTPAIISVPFGRLIASDESTVTPATAGDSGPSAPWKSSRSPISECRPGHRGRTEANVSPGESCRSREGRGSCPEPRIRASARNLRKSTQSPPICLATFGSLSGPRTTTATTKMTNSFAGLRNGMTGSGI